MEDCPDGELTKEQFVDMYNKIFPGGRADRQQKKMNQKITIIKRISDFQKSFSVLLMRTGAAQSTSASSCWHSTSPPLGLQRFMKKISRNEKLKNSLSQEKLTWAFKMYDIDGNGSIDFNELKRFVPSNISSMSSTRDGNCV